jgi:RNA polymerase sigma-70 factor (ECF subfamily)
VNEDARLIDQTLAGHSEAFGQLVQRYQDRLYNTLLHVIGDPEEARDTVQDAFVQAFVKLHTFHGSSTFYTWLNRIAFNLAATRQRRRHFAGSIEQMRERGGAEPVDQAGNPAEQLERRERCRMVRAAIAALSQDHRAVLVLREIDGFCYETIAEILNLPVGTVRSRLHRARVQLREQLKEMLIVER